MQRGKPYRTMVLEGESDVLRLVRAPRLTLEGEERKKISAIVQQALDTRPQLKLVA